MLLRTDNLAGASPEIIAAIAAVAGDSMPPYGDDAITERLIRRFSDVFGCDLDVFPTVSGTAANALALALAAPPYSAVYCHENAHIADGEAGAFEFYTQGARLVGLPGADGKIDAANLGARIVADLARPSHPRPSAVSITQLSEAGTLYPPDGVCAIGQIARTHGLALHMDGARFATAVAALGCTPAATSVGVGVDILSFGATKNGTLMADAIVVFRKDLAKEIRARRKRAGLTIAKMRFLSAQLEAYLTNDLWLRNAEHANSMMARLVQGIAGTPGVSFVFPPQANELFLGLAQPVAAAIARAGIVLRCKSIEADGRSIYRLVTSFATPPEQIDHLARAIVTAARASASGQV